MEVGVRELRRHLSHWLNEVRDGTEVIVTERGKPIARLIGLSGTTAIERLVEEGMIRRALARVEPATGRRRIRAREGVSELVEDQRR